MTTIAANREMMCADSKVSDDETYYHTTKIFVIDKFIVGAVGSVEETNRFLSWFKRGRPENGPEFLKIDGESTFCALALGAAGLYFFPGCCPPDLITDDYHAIGGGAQAALAALHLGHDPERAVEVACRVHVGSGLPVQTLRLRDVGKKKRA